jgi:hypothetical protein
MEETPEWEVKGRGKDDKGYGKEDRWAKGKGIGVYKGNLKGAGMGRGKDWGKDKGKGMDKGKGKEKKGKSMKAKYETMARKFEFLEQHGIRPDFALPPPPPPLRSNDDWFPGRGVFKGSKGEGSKGDRPTGELGFVLEHFDLPHPSSYSKGKEKESPQRPIPLPLVVVLQGVSIGLLLRWLLACMVVPLRRWLIL